MRFFFKVFLIIALLVGARLAWAQSAGGTMAFDCWVSEEKDHYKTNYIRCIRNISHFPASDSAAEPENAFVYERIYRLLHEGGIEELDRYVRENIWMLKAGDIWSIRIFSYPSPWSWDEGLPQRLVRTLFCQKGYTCPVYIRRG